MKSKTKVMISVIFVSIFILYIEVVGNFSEILSPEAGEARARERAGVLAPRSGNSETIPSIRNRIVLSSVTMNKEKNIPTHVPSVTNEEI